METRNDASCEKIQELLLDQNTGKSDEIVTRHLETCEKCREFQKTLAAISRSAQITSDEHLRPDPRIINVLKKNFKKQSTFDSILDPLMAMFRKRIPVYQIMLAVFIAAISYFSVTKIHISNTKPVGLNFSSEVESQTIQPVEFPVLPLEQDQQMGKSLAEDSLLAKFRVSIL